ncbi:wsv354 [White spot syndrome virus]|uniref:Wsv354 n=4 Tax=White spot syndrome virus TaxID=342409 RepID=Q8VAP7_WSSVS|nr:wsv354 [Shrimp white spot syndrome virus]AFX59731.1 wsv354 [White spot syndrome virus]AAL33356.1 wsv354 [Shrimp white spot syndrome virus]AAL89281.1 WSSV413 [Shrimp white spot syndrome virus]AWQ60481.1 wsv354 [Shrimp white spot syndrome virus]AWQ60926.1 wsv354 [Shrimp white spot syndrome virus]
MSLPSQSLTKLPQSIGRLLLKHSLTVSRIVHSLEAGLLVPEPYLVIKFEKNSESLLVFPFKAVRMIHSSIILKHSYMLSFETLWSLK